MFRSIKLFLTDGCGWVVLLVVLVVLLGVYVWSNLEMP